jgi:hypothetical protein
MDSFYDRLINRAATIDELLSDDFEAIPAEKDCAEFGQRRLVAWCQSAASGDWSLFGRRIERDGLDSAGVLARLTAVRRKPAVPTPQWVADAAWILPALEGAASKPASEPAGAQAEPVAFEHLLAGAVGFRRADVSRARTSAESSSSRLILRSKSDQSPLAADWHQAARRR